MPCNVESSDGSGCLSCKAAGTIKSCRVYRKPVQPLAFDLLGKVKVRLQESSPLFSILPKELRDIIYEYALTDDNNHPNQDQPVRREWKYTLPKPNIAFNLLLTCRAAYLEAYQLAYILNPVIIHGIRTSPNTDIATPKVLKLAPWQFALIQSLEISMQQTQLEGSAFRNYAPAYKAAERHRGAIVLAQYFNRAQLQASDAMPAFDLFGLKQKDQAETTKSLENSLDNPALPNQPMTARPLVKLTIRMSRTDWWTWTDAPTNIRSQLGLDPSIGDGSARNRPTTAVMLQLAEDRRRGPWRGYTDPLCWGNTISKFQSLKEFTLVLETFAAKKSQLDNVVQSAKTWKFPMGEHHELKYAGKVESSTWRLCASHDKRGSSQAFSYRSGRIPWREPQDIQVPDGQAVGLGSPSVKPDPNEFEVRIIRWKRVQK
ncbi:uncharacterized protein K441DRAFT_112954 [Cenococcum geophilum 1.58]|uniref:uncharacterized protein n=1 Tax=Cenococcum geophilum 1.58 TaxID=794803 RepID=UPI00358F6641|nr:hypothetical protein K441DRAFT_112954 [Cenococcum geophilum 1.58]